MIENINPKLYFGIGKQVDTFYCLVNLCFYRVQECALGPMSLILTLLIVHFREFKMNAPKSISYFITKVPPYFLEFIVFY